MISKQTGLTWKKDFPKALRSLLFEEPSYLVFHYVGARLRLTRSLRNNVRALEFN